MIGIVLDFKIDFNIPSLYMKKMPKKSGISPGDPCEESEVSLDSLGCLDLVKLLN